MIFGRQYLQFGFGLGRRGRGLGRSRGRRGRSRCGFDADFRSCGNRRGSLWSDRGLGGFGSRGRGLDGSGGLFWGERVLVLAFDADDLDRGGLVLARRGIGSGGRGGYGSALSARKARTAARPKRELGGGGLLRLRALHGGGRRADSLG
ncbi:hypothetical protein DB347_05600 [Opitutaceae bacterium EW11]|nr:hypothetical protein DB347_05600 [Opitutaceae bacterium EW11]